MAELTGAAESAAEIAATFRDALAGAAAIGRPYRHWLLHGAMSQATMAAIRDLPIAAPQIAETLGKRETNNATRSYFSVENRARHPVCRAVAAAFQDAETVHALEEACGTRLGGGFLRIEYCQDSDGFWLEPHTDIDAKLFTLLIYLSAGPGTAEWGTDIYDGDRQWVGRAPFGAGRGLIFVPGGDTWHGFASRPIHGIRRSVIVNYVKNEWRARDELSFPDTPVG